MQDVAYSRLQRAVALRMRWDPDALDSQEFAQIRDAISRAIDQVWRDHWWSFLLQTRQRQCATTYDASATYAAGTFVYLPGPDAYYQAVRSTMGNAPATYSAGTWTLNSAYWALAARTLGGNDYSATVAYVPGDAVRNTTDGLFYHCHTATTGNAPTDTSYWGQWVPWVPEVPLVETGFYPIGDVHGVARNNIEAFPDPGWLKHRVTDTGVMLLDGDVTRPWLTWLRRPHVFEGTAWDATVTYTAASNDEITGNTTTVSGTNDSSGVGYAGIAALRAREEHTDGQLAYLLYVATDGDGAQGWFRFRASSSTADDGVDVLKPDDIDSGNPGRWHRTS